MSADRDHEDDALSVEFVSDDPDLEALLDMLARPVEVGSPRPGVIIGAGQRYQLGERLGRGGQGVVFEAKDLRMRRAVAIKFVLPDEDDSADSWALRCARFEDEIGLLSSLQHDAIVTTHDRDVWEGIPFLVMARLEGRTLRSELRQHGVLPLRRTVNLGLQIARGLQAAHQQGIVHRDLKPENIFVLPGDRIKILDFGLATLARAPEDEALPSQDDPHAARGGTARYMAPEQWRGQHQDARTDVWAFGVVLYEMLSGAHPYAATSTGSLRDAVLHHAPTPLLSRVNAIALPAPLLALISKTMQRDLRRRPSNIHTVLTELEALHHHLQVATTPFSGDFPVPKAPAPSVKATPAPQPPRPPLQAARGDAPARTPAPLPTSAPTHDEGRRRWWWVAVATMGVLIGLSLTLMTITTVHTQRVEYLNDINLRSAYLQRRGGSQVCLPESFPMEACAFITPKHIAVVAFLD